MEIATAKFHPGQIIHHVRFRYRGVIFDVDPCCIVDSSCWQSIELQPEREQPWYHVLVDGSDAVTYVAESSLEAETAARPVEHPLVGVLLGCYQGGRYFRGLDA